METQKIKYKGITYTIEFKDLRSIHKNSILCNVVKNGIVISNKKHLIIDKTLTREQKYSEIHNMLGRASKYELRTLNDCIRVKNDLNHLEDLENLSKIINKINEFGGISKSIEKLNTNGQLKIFNYLIDLLDIPKYRLQK